MYDVHKDSADEEPSQTQEALAAEPNKGRKSLARLRRTLSDDELSSSGVQRMLVDDIERLESDLGDAKKYRDAFHKADRLQAVAYERIKVLESNDWLFAVALSLGAAAIGLVPSFWSQQPGGYIFLAFGGSLIVGSLLSKRRKP